MKNGRGNRIISRMLKSSDSLMFILECMTLQYIAELLSDCSVTALRRRNEVKINVQYLRWVAGETNRHLNATQC